jgi:hypothetical protein
MLATLLLATVPCLPQGSGSSSAAVVINEFSFDDAGVDDREFVELLNRTAAPVDISGWSLQGEEGSAGGAPNGAFVFPSGTILAPGQYLVVGMATVPNVTFFTTATFPNEWLGENVAGAATLPDGLTLRDALGAVVDAVVWNYAVWTAPVPAWLEGSGLYGAMQMIDAGGQPPEGFLTAQRKFDGYDDDDNGRDFVQMQWTPGAPNGAFNTQLPALREDCDGGVGTTLLPLFAFSFTPATLFDPAAVTVATGTVRPFPPSPQGGNVARLQDPTGGGNMVTAQTLVSGDFLLECFVHVPAGNPAMTTGEGEWWSIGVGGTTDTFAHPYDASGSYFAQSTLCAATRSFGATGLAWTAYVSPTQTAIYLVDMGNGGPGSTVLAGPIVATTGVNDGWQRVRLRVAGNAFVANFGGNFGVDDGQRFTGAVAPGAGTIHMGYRECLVANANITGLLVDRIEIWTPLTSAVSFSGVPSPTTFGTPNIGTVGVPQVGSNTFQITSSGMIPNGLAVLAVDAGSLLPGVQVPGAPPSLLLYAAPTATVVVPNSPAGVAAFPFAIPAVNALAGIGLATQYFDLDIALPFALPFGSSRGCQILIGN